MLGHEFMGEVAEVGPDVTKHKVGDRVVVGSFISCGQCWYCQQELWSLCDNGNPNPAITEALWGQSIGGCYGYSHAMGGCAGSHAAYIRVPYADSGRVRHPRRRLRRAGAVRLRRGADRLDGRAPGGVKPGDVVAVWGAGGVGQMAARAAMLIGAERVIVIDRLRQPARSRSAAHIGAETLDYERGRRRRRAAGDDRRPGSGRLHRGGRAWRRTAPGPQYLYDQVKQQLRLQTDRPTAVREAIYACRKGGTVFALGRLRRPGGQVPARRGDEQGR